MRKNFGYASLKVQQKELIRIILINPILKKILTTLEFPGSHPWYLTAGCINQTVWNYLTGRDITHGIGDYDLIYWSKNISTEEQDEFRTSIEKKGKVMMVRSKEDKYSGWDFPGGKLLWNEDVFTCAQREVLEESRYKVKLDKLLGIYQRKTGPDDEDYFRFMFIGSLAHNHQRKIGDPDILEVK